MWDVEEERTKVLNRLRRAEGQMRGVQKMVSDDRECVDVVIQLSAIRASIDRVMGVVLANNMKKVLMKSNGADLEENIEDIETALDLIIRN